MIHWTNVSVDNANYDTKLNYKTHNNFELYDYQKNIYCQMVKAMNKNNVNVDSKIFNINYNNLNATIESKLGILGTPVGSGKTWLILHLIKNYNFTDILNNVNNLISLNFSNNLFNLKFKSIFLNSSLIIVNNNQMLNQWIFEAEYFFNLKLNIFKGELSNNNIYITTFNHFHNYNTENLFIKFLIIDELNFSFVNSVNSKFTWILSADAPYFFNSNCLDKKHSNSNLGQIKKFREYLKIMNCQEPIPFLITCSTDYKNFVNLNFKFTINYINISNFKQHYEGVKMIILNDYFYNNSDMNLINFKNHIVNYFLLNYNSFLYIDKDYQDVSFNTHDLYIVKQSLINNGLNFQNVSHVFFFPFASLNYEILINQLLHRFIRIRRYKDLKIWQFVDNELFKNYLTIEVINN